MAAAPTVRGIITHEIGKNALGAIGLGVLGAIVIVATVFAAVFQ